MITEALEVVGKLNDEVKEMFESEFGWEFPPFNLNTDGERIIIMLFDCFQLWWSEEDERAYTNEEAEEYEPLEGFLRREAQFILDQIATIKLV